MTPTVERAGGDSAAVLKAGCPVGYAGQPIRSYPLSFELLSPVTHQARSPRQESARCLTIRDRAVAPIGARAKLANAVADVVDVSQTGVLIRVSDELRPGSEWPLVLESPSAAPAQVTGRVVRCEPVAVSLPAGAVLEGHYLLALTFVDPSTEAQAVLDQVCGTSVEPPERPG